MTTPAERRLSGHDDNDMLIFFVASAAFIFICSYFNFWGHLWYYRRLIELTALQHIAKLLPQIFTDHYSHARHWLMQHDLPSSQERQQFDHYFYFLIWPCLLITLCGSLSLLRFQKPNFADPYGLRVRQRLMKKCPWLIRIANDDPLTQPQFYSKKGNNTYAQAMRPGDFATHPACWVNREKSIFDEHAEHFDAELAKQVFTEQLNNGLITKGIVTHKTIDYQERPVVCYLRFIQSFSSTEQAVIDLIQPYLPTRDAPIYVPAINQKETIMQPLKSDQQYLVNGLRKHQTTRALILALYEIALSEGPIPINHFLGIAHADRPLFLALSSIGREQAFIEAAGIMAQFETEKALYLLDPALTPLSHIEVTGAVESLQHYIENLLEIHL